MADYRELEAAELRRWQETGAACTLLDVREPEEWDLARIPGAMEIPMRDVRARIGEIPAEKPVVAICHYGERSKHVARLLLANGFHDVYNLEGGIDAYALEIDPSVGRY